MTRPGRVDISTREKATSNDIVRAQALLAQDLMELLRGMGANPSNPNGTPSEDRSAVVQGMGVRPGVVGLSIIVEQGRAIVMRPAGPPGPDESAAQLAAVRSVITQVLTAADPANPRFDLIEIEPASEVTEQQSRDVYNPGTGTFAPVLVPKITRPSIIGNGAVIGVVHYTAGAPAAFPVVPAFTTGRIPLAAIRVAAAALTVAVGDVLDMRPMWMPAPMTRQHGVIDGLDLSSASSTDFAAFNVGAGTAVVDGQLVKRTTLDVRSSTGVFDANTTPAANTWYFAYLFACRDGNGFRPRVTGINSLLREGIVLLSDVPPDAQGYPSSPVAFPVAVGGVGDRLFAGDVSRRGLYLGAVRTGAVATNFSPFYRDADWIYRLEHIVSFTAGASPSTTTVDLAAVAGLLPSTCRMVQVNMLPQFITDAGSTPHLMDLELTGSGINRTRRQFVPRLGGIDLINGGVGVVPIGSSQTFDVNLQNVGGVDRWSGALQQFGIAGLYDPRPKAR